MKGFKKLFCLILAWSSSAFAVTINANAALYLSGGRSRARKAVVTECGSCTQGWS